MSENNKNVPKIRFPGFTDAWEQCEFQDFTKLSQGLQIAIDKRFFEPGENRMFYITNEFLNPNSDKKYYIESPSKSVMACKEDILMTRTGNTGKVVTNVEGAFHNNFFKIAYNNKETAKLYLYYLLNSFPIQKEILAKAGTSTIPDLNHNDFYKIKVNTPPFEEQTKIGNFFKQLDEIITLHRRKLNHLQDEKKSLLQKMFPKNGADVPEIRFPGFTGAWEQRKLGELAESFEYGLNAAATEFDGENKYLRITDIDDETHEFKTDSPTSPNVDFELADNYRLQEGDVLFARTGASVGKTYRYKDFDGLVYFAGFLIRARIKPEYDSEFVFQNTLTDKYNRFIKITSQRSGQPGVNAQEYADFIILVPKLDEQRKIGAFFHNLDHLITLHQRKFNHLQEQKKALLQQMFV